MSLPYKQELISRARELRKEMTPQEKHLWFNYLRSYPIRFQRQKTIGSFIADFYCHKAKLIVEIDGSQHYTEQGTAYDEERTAILSQYDLKVIRFSNYEVNTSFDEVCLSIDTEVRKRLGK